MTNDPEPGTTVRDGPGSGSGSGSGAGRPEVPRLDELAVRLSDLARELEHESDLGSTLEAIVHAAVGTVPGAEHASISSISRRREVKTLGSTGPLPREIDRAQYETEQGPCLETLYEQQTVRLTDLRTETRWPQFIARAIDLGVGSMLVVRLFVQGDELGALNLASTVLDAFDEESEHVALLFAAHATVAMAGAGQRDRLHQAMSTRDLIGQAKGILMERFKVSGEQAFALLVRASQTSNRKLHDIASELVHTGVMPRTTPPAPREPGSA